MSTKTNNNTPRLIDQNLIDKIGIPTIKVTCILESSLTEELLRDFLNGQPFPETPPAARRVGLASSYTQTGHLAALAVAMYREVLIIQLPGRGNGNSKARTSGGRAALQDVVLADPELALYAFTLGPLATSLFLDHGLRMRGGVDVQSGCGGGAGGGAALMAPLAALEFAAGDHFPVFRDNVLSTFAEAPFDVSILSVTASLALRAWIAGYVPSIGDMEEAYHAVKRVNTCDMDDSQLSYVAELARGDQRLNSAKATSTKHEFATSSLDQQTAKVQAQRFQQRFHKETEIELHVRDEHGNSFVVPGRTTDVNGRTANIRVGGIMNGKTITAITTVGGDLPTSAENQKAITILKFLQGTADIFSNPFLKYIWFPDDDFSWPETWDTSSTSIPDVVSSRPLNDSQEQAVLHMLSPDPVSMLQGPPGSGKTTVIGAFVCSSIAAGRTGIWLVAQSNVAVKNIAEKLADVGFLNFRLLVSMDFHLEWHEHLYRKINKNIIRSDQFKKASSLLQNTQVILCTLSMLSNPRIDLFTRLVPIQTLVIDEASQISLSDYIPALRAFPTIHKMCFIGDDKQLPPYGQEQIEVIRSVFEVSHLKSSAVFLNIQYRMPPQIGDFISDSVYDGQLRSNPLHPVKDEMPACFFVDVDDGHEQRNGTSWMNISECKAALKIAAKLQDEGKNYRFITPYDAQRSAMEDLMKKSGLRWADKCFNVDSFQGNEEDYIVISLVRSKNELGFLVDLRRTNVMLSRCKRGMYILSSWDFLCNGVGHKSLVGRMANAWGDAAWLAVGHLEEVGF